MKINYKSLVALVIGAVVSIVCLRCFSTIYSIRD